MTDGGDTRMTLNRLAALLRGAGALLRRSEGGGIDINLVKVVLSTDSKPKKERPPC
jgi:hypothetical protein